MPEFITADTFTNNDLKGLNLRKEVQDLVIAALSAGWVGQKTQRGLTLKPYATNGSPIHLSKSPRNNSGPLRQLREKIVRYGDPLKLALLNNPGGDQDGHVFVPRTPDQAVIPKAVSAAWLAQQEPSFVIALRGFDRGDVQKALASAHTAGIGFTSANQALDFIQTWIEERGKIIAEQEALTEVKETEEMPVPTPATARHVLSIKPYMAKSHKGTESRPGKVYASASVLERQWSDGTVDYQCNLCTASSMTPVGVNSHRKKHTNAGEVPVIGNAVRAGLSTLVDDPNYTESTGTRNRVSGDVEPAEYNPREDRISALAAELLQAMEGKHGETPAEIADRLARRALGWVHAQQGNGGPHAPRTADEILDAVRSLVDRGEYLRLREEAETAQQAAREYSEAAEKSQRKADKWKGELQSLRELVSGVGSDDDED